MLLPRLLFRQHRIIVDLSKRPVDILFGFFIDVIGPHMEKENSRMQLGGEGVEVEADEVAFRMKAKEDDDDESGWKKVWLRIICFVRRGSGKPFLSFLPDREVNGIGQGGGGALSVEELKRVMRVTCLLPLLLARTILHTDSAKAYKRVGPFRWGPPGALRDATGGVSFYA